MQIFHGSELMENQKHAVVMTPDAVFDVLQSQSGDALFFSIGTDGVFYLTREVTQSQTGWTRVDLSSALSSQHGGAEVTAKSFAVSQNPHTLTVDVALVVTSNGADLLYLSLGNANTDAAWADGVTWTASPFDSSNPPSPLTIEDVYVMSTPPAGETIFVDVLRTPGDPAQLIDRYYVTPGTSPQWNPHLLAADFSAGSVSSCLGMRQNDPTAGIYTFGTIGGESQLLFTPEYNYFQSGVAPQPARLLAPAGATAIAAALGSSGTTTLFVAGSDGLYVFAPGNQNDQATPVQIVTSGVVVQASALAAASSGQRTAVWGLDPQKNLFYLSCPAGSETSPSAWSTPVPLLSGAEEFAFFLDTSAANTVLFAQTAGDDGQTLVKLTQDPVTTQWSHRSILLPGTDPNDLVTFDSFTTHIRVADDNGVSVPNVAVTIATTSTAQLYVNDAYVVLSPSAPLSTTTDVTGVLTIVQETQSLAAAGFTVTLPGTPAVSVTIDPMSNAMAVLGGIQSGDDLANVQVTNADGSTTPLLPANVTQDQRNAAASSIAQLVKIRATLPQNGASPSTTGASSTWGLSLANGGATYAEGPAALMPAATSSSSPVEALLGDVVQAITGFFDQLEHVAVQLIEDDYHLWVWIGGTVYHALLDIPGVGHVVNVVLNWLGVVFDDVVKWLGYVFGWSDILNTHNVMKSVIGVWSAHAVAQLPALTQQLQSAFEGLKAQIDSWAQIPDTADPVGSYAQAGASTPGLDTPQANWGMHHFKSNAAATAFTGTPPSPPSPDDSVLGELTTMIGNEVDIWTTALQQLQTDVVDQFSTLTPVQIIEKITAILTDDLLSTAENVLVTALAVIQTAATGLASVLEATISIPVLSPIYYELTGNDLSILDVVCLIAAIPATILYRAVAGQAPFSANDAAQLGSASDYATLYTLLTGNAPATTA